MPPRQLFCQAYGEASSNRIKGVLRISFPCPLATAAIAANSNRSKQPSHFILKGLQPAEVAGDEEEFWLTIASASRQPFVWQAQYTEPPGGVAARVAAAGPRLPFVWQAQDIEPPGGVAARVAAAGPQLPFVWQAQ